LLPRPQRIVGSFARKPIRRIFPGCCVTRRVESLRCRSPGAIGAKRTYCERSVHWRRVRRTRSPVMPPVLRRLSGFAFPLRPPPPPPLPASQCVDVLNILRQRHFKPAFAAILSAEHLAIARRDVDLLGVAVMQTDRHQRAVRRHPVEALPSLADVLAAVERAVFR